MTKFWKAVGVMDSQILETGVSRADVMRKLSIKYPTYVVTGTDKDFMKKRKERVPIYPEPIRLICGRITKSKGKEIAEMKNSIDQRHYLH